jgi:ribonuclease D
MPFSRLAELRIRDAMEQGVFDNLPGAGKPLDLEEYFAVPEEMRMAYSILKNAQCPPAEVQLLQEVAKLREAVAAATDPDEKRLLQKTLTWRLMDVAMRLERVRLSGQSRSGASVLRFPDRPPR